MRELIIRGGIVIGWLIVVALITHCDCPGGMTKDDYKQAAIAYVIGVFFMEALAAPLI